MSNKLNPHDLQQAIRRLPKELVQELRNHPGKIMVGGGYLRSVVANEFVNDIDVFVPSRADAEALAKRLSAAGRSGGRPTRKIHESPFAYSVHEYKPMIQIIHRWTFDNCESVCQSFDFTCCAAAFTWESFESDPKAGRWTSYCDEGFYTAVAAKRLIYTCPKREEEPGGSTLRILKYYQKGYRVPLDSLSQVLSRLFLGVINPDKPWRIVLEERDEYQLARILCGLLRDVDPAVDPAHLSHLPAAEDFAERHSSTEA